MLQTLAEIVLHVDVFIKAQVDVWGAWMYLLFFVVLFAETGFVVTPFLPGDSLLFAAGAVAAQPGSPLDIWILVAVTAVAAVGGDTVNYWIGHRLGPAVLNRPDSRVFRKEYLDKTHAYFARYGGKTIILARFVPIVRTFAPFLAGVGEMDYPRFIRFNVIGGIVWVVAFLFAGYFFGRIPAVEENLTIALIAMVVITTIPIIVEGWRTHRESKREAAAGARKASGGRTGDLFE